MSDIPGGEPMYKITYSEPGPDYCDGFADGYSRAWKECWEHMRQIAQNESVAPPDEAKRGTGEGVGGE